MLCSCKLEIIQFPLPLLSSPSSSKSNSRHVFVTSNSVFKYKNRKCNFNQLKVRASPVATNSEAQYSGSNSDKFFENLKSEQERIDRLEDFERQAKLQLERQLVLASEWSRALLTMRGKLKGTQWDPETSHNIDYSEFQQLLDSKKVQYMEYSNYGRNVSVILPYYKNEISKGSDRVSKKEIVFRRHAVERMPVDCWNDVWMKLHQQLVNVDVHNVNVVSAEVYSTAAIAAVWCMRFAVAVALFVGIDSMMKPIYGKVIPFRKSGSPPKKIIQPLEIDKTLGSLGKSRAKFIRAEETTGVTFNDFAGQEYIKRELQEVVRILKNDPEFQNKGIYCPKGVLLYGPPGTGKTLLAKAIAGEAGIPFFAVNGTDFVEMFSGVAASRVKDLFATARSYAPSIIFIDEIDAIGGKRGGPDIGGGGAEREQGLLQILTELDGFEESTAQVLMIGATNRLDILDPALLRKGRFDKIIRVGLPSRDGRLAILKVHARNKSFYSEAEKQTLLEEIAELTEDFTGAELQNILNEAAILTSRKDQDYIRREELLESLQRQEGTYETGQEDNIVLPEEVKLRIAYREAAIAVLACYFPDPNCHFTKTDINTFDSGSNMSYKKMAGRMFYRKVDYVNNIIRSCAPRVIDEEIFGVDNLSWMAASATTKASKVAEFLILRTGTTSLGKAYYRTHDDIMPHLAAKIEALREEYIRFAMEKCLQVLREYRSAVEAIADILLEKSEIEADEIWKIYTNSPRVLQPAVRPVDEYGALIYSGRWGVHGVSLPGRVTYAPGNVGFATFGAPRPMETQVISDDTWSLVDRIKDEAIQNLVTPPEKEHRQFFMARHFL